MSFHLGGSRNDIKGGVLLRLGKDEVAVIADSRFNSGVFLYANEQIVLLHNAVGTRINHIHLSRCSDQHHTHTGRYIGYFEQVCFIVLHARHRISFEALGTTEVNGIGTCEGTVSRCGFNNEVDSRDRRGNEGGGQCSSHCHFTQYVA